VGDGEAGGGQQEVEQDEQQRHARLPSDQSNINQSNYFQLTFLSGI
jgi:hypothetical protein